MAPTSVKSVDVTGDNNIVTATRNASTINELVSTLPQTWRPALSEYLLIVYRVATKLCNVQNTLAQYERHVADGSFPASVRNSIKDPKIQFSKEYLGTTEGNLAKGTLLSLVHAAQKSILQGAVKQKQEELATLQRLTVFDQEAWRKRVGDVASRAATAYGSTVEGTATDANPPRWSGSAPETIKEECKQLWKQGSVYHYRAVAIARSLADRTLLDRVKTMTIKKDTDVKMKDADMESSTRDVVREELQAFRKEMSLLKVQLSKPNGKGQKPPGKGKQKSGGSKPNGVTKGKPKKKKGPNRRV